MGRTVRSGRLAVSGFLLFGIVLATQVITSGWKTQVYANQFRSLQQAVDSLPAEGGTVSLTCGSYGAVTISRPNVAIIGAGDCSSITAPASGSSGIVTVTGGATHTIISSVRILGQAVDQSTIQRCIYLTGGSTGTTIEHVKFGGISPTSGCNIQIHADPTSARNLITKNTFTQAVGTGSGGGYGILVESSTSNVITNNVSIQTATQGRHHIYLSVGASSNVVMNNKLSGGTSDQIVIYSLDSQPAARYNLIQNNVLRGMATGLGAKAAIHICHNATLNRVIGNQVLEPAVAGIEIEASAIKGQAHADRNDLENNQIYFAGHFGILILGSSSNTIRGNTIYEASQAVPGSYAGLEVSSNSIYAIAHSNQISGNTSYGPQKQRCGLQIDSGTPAPHATVVNLNRFGVGAIGRALNNGGRDTRIGMNILDYQNPNPPKA
ncbi:MAG TPA: right-handed parallel beta-helix repeat-containing protein [Terriglobia bacterium]|nr:right-handed parallel beta-helix repeat-containing protein [Terriglobia bacterium]